MLNGFISALTTAPEGFSERAKIAGIVSLEGMVVIFCALTILWIAIEILHFVLHHKSASKIEEDTPASVPKAPAAPASSAPVVSASSNDAALIAAITAAISAAMAEEGYTGSFRVVSFKRANTRKNRF